MADSEFIKDVRIGERKIGHNKLRKQQPCDHCVMNDPTGALFIAAARFQSTLFNRRLDRLVVDLVKIDDPRRF